MKKTTLFLLSASALLALASCKGINGSGKSSSSGSASEPSSSASTGEPASSESSESSESSGEPAESSESSAESQPTSEASESSEPAVLEPAIALPEGVTSSVNTGDKVKLIASNFLLGAKITWSSSDTAAAVIDEDGEVEFFAPGEVTISAVSGEYEANLLFSVTDPEEKKSGSCTGTDSIPSEIAIGEVIDLDELITIKNVTHYWLDSDSETIEIVGHKVIAVEAGEFTFRIHLGRGRRSISGVVSSEEKIAFNQLANSIAGDYSSYLFGTGDEVYVNEDGFMALTGVSEDDEENDVYHYAGSIYDYEGGEILGFSVDSAPDYEAGDYAYVNFEVSTGYGQSKEDRGLVGWPEDISTSYFTETEVELGDETDSYTVPGFYYLDKTQYQENAELIYDSLFGGGWFLFSNPKHYGIEADGVVMVPDVLVNEDESEQNVLYVYPCDSNGKPIEYFTYDGEEFSTLGVIFDIGATEIEPIADWKAEPYYPESVDHSALDDFFTDITEAKTYVMEGKAQWYDGNEETEAPENMTFSDADFGPFPNIEIEGAVNEFGRTYELTKAEDAYCIPEESGANYVWQTGAAWIEAVGEGKLYTGHGNREAGADDVTWEAVEPYDLGSNEMTSLWDPLLVVNPVPAWLAPEYDEETEETFTLFDYASIIDHEVNDQGDETFVLNTYGPDSTIEIYNGCGYGGVLGNLLWLGYGFNWGYSLGYYLNAVEWFPEAVYSVTVSADGKSLTFDMPNIYSSSIVYDISYTLTIVDEDPMAPAAAEIIHSVNPDYIVPVVGEPIQGGEEE